MSSLGRFLGPGVEPGTGRDGTPLPTPVTVGRPDVLRRFLGPRPPPPPVGGCELCAAPIGPEHRHLVDIGDQSLRCSCRGCALLFDDAGPQELRYRAVPERYQRLDPFDLDPLLWTELQIPVGIAFLMDSTPAGRTVAFYPGPAGATESELPLHTWARIVAANPPLADVEADVEAILIRATGGGPGGGAGAIGSVEPACYVVPVDRCYELVGELRLHWHGFDGGQEVRAHIAAFFADIDRRSQRVGATR